MIEPHRLAGDRMVDDRRRDALGADALGVVEGDGVVMSRAVLGDAGTGRGAEDTLDLAPAADMADIADTEGA